MRMQNKNWFITLAILLAGVQYSPAVFSQGLSDTLESAQEHNQAPRQAIGDESSAPGDDRGRQEGGPMAPGGQTTTAQADSPMTDFTAAAISNVLLVAFLVITLLGGGILILNLGMLSKRANDRVGERDPSDVAILKNETWPEAPYEDNIFPARDENVHLSAKHIREKEAREREEILHQLNNQKENRAFPNDDHQTQLDPNAGKSKTA